MFERIFKALFFVLLFSFPLAVQSQDEEYSGPVYIRPDYKIYKSLGATLQNPDSVYILEIKGKKLKEFPSSIFKLPNLIVLDLSRNKIKTLPDSISTLRRLQELNLSGNKLKKVPDNIGALKQLKKLSLNRNVIEGLPPSIGNLESLEFLELWDNEIDTLPDEIKNLKKLRVLELRGILFSEEQQSVIRELLPDARVYMSPSCNCK